MFFDTPTWSRRLWIASSHLLVPAAATKSPGEKKLCWPQPIMSNNCGTSMKCHCWVSKSSCVWWSHEIDCPRCPHTWRPFGNTQLPTSQKPTNSMSQGTPTWLVFPHKLPHTIAAAESVTVCFQERSSVRHCHQPSGESQEFKSQQNDCFFKCVYVRGSWLGCMSWCYSGVLTRWTWPWQLLHVEAITSIKLCCFVSYIYHPSDAKYETIHWLSSLSHFASHVGTNT